jgi:hypothetical protein
MDSPQTRQEKKKNQKQKGRPDKLGTSKHIRAMEALREQKNRPPGLAASDNKNKK